jgi:hypothetical protein
LLPLVVNFTKAPLYFQDPFNPDLDHLETKQTSTSYPIYFQPATATTTEDGRPIIIIIIIYICPSDSTGNIRVALLRALHV